MRVKEIRELNHLCIKDTISEYAGEEYVIYPTCVTTSTGKVFHYVTDTGHLLSEEFKNKHFIEWSE